MSTNDSIFNPGIVKPGIVKPESKFSRDKLKEVFKFLSPVLLAGFFIALVVVVLYLLGVINIPHIPPEFSENIRKAGSTYLNQVNPMVNVLPVNRDTSYPLPAHPITGESRPLGQNVLSQNIADTNKIPEAFTTWYDQNVANAMSAMSLYARGSSSGGSYGVNTGYNHKRALLVDATGTTPIRIIATVANNTDQPGNLANPRITMQHVLPDGRRITVPIPANTQVGQAFRYNAGRVRRATAGPNSANSAALKLGFTPAQIAANDAAIAAGGEGDPAIAAANVGENWMARAATQNSATQQQMSTGINSMNNPVIQTANNMPNGQPAP